MEVVRRTVAEAYLAGGTGTAANSKYAKLALESIEEVEKAGHTVRHIEDCSS